MEGDGATAERIADAIVGAKKRLDYTLIPIEVITRRDLSVGAKCTLAAVFYIQHRGDFKGDLVDVVAMLIAISREKSLKYLRELESAKIIKRRSEDDATEKAS